MYMYLDEHEHMLIDPAMREYEKTGNPTYKFRLPSTDFFMFAPTTAKRLIEKGAICDVSPNLLTLDRVDEIDLMDPTVKYQFSLTDKLIREFKWDL